MKLCYIFICPVFTIKCKLHDNRDFVLLTTESLIPNTGKEGSQWKETSKQTKPQKPDHSRESPESRQGGEFSSSVARLGRGAPGSGRLDDAETGRRAIEKEREGRQKTGSFPVPKAETVFISFWHWCVYIRAPIGQSLGSWISYWGIWRFFKFSLQAQFTMDTGYHMLIV